MRNAFIIGGGILIVAGLALGGWTYLMYTGTTVADVTAPTGDPFPEGAPLSVPAVEPSAAGDATFPVSGEKLRQLTTRRVIGAALVTTDLGAVVRYAEAGTGHLFEVPLRGGNEIRISNTTFPKATDALWSPQGTRVVLTQETENGTESFLGMVTKNDEGTGTLEGATLPEGSHSFGFADSGDIFYYALTDESGTRGIERNLKTRKETTVFSVPLREVTVAWEPSPLIVTKASYALTGYAYTAGLERITEPTLALRGIGDARGYVFGGMNSGELRGWIEATTTIPLDRGITPDKCALTREQVVCGVPKSLQSRDFPDSWYRGEVTLEDAIYAFNRTTGTSDLVVDPIDLTRRSVDIARFEQSDSEADLVFTSKNDRSLWLLSI